MKTDVIWAGTAENFFGLFGNAITKEPADPTQLAFSFSVDGGEATTYFFGVGDQITKLGVGSYQVTVDTTGMAPAGEMVTLTGQWDCIGSVEVSGSVDVPVRAPKITPPTFPS